MDWLGLFFRLDGRIGRKPFWLGLAPTLAALFVADRVFADTAILWAVWALLLYPLVALLVKRLHDRGRSGWWALLLVAPLIVAIGAGAAASMMGRGYDGVAAAATWALYIACLLLAVLIVFELGVRPGDPRYSLHGPPPID